MYVLSLPLLFAFLIASNGASNADTLATLPEYFPSPWSAGGPDGWDDAYERAREFISTLTVLEKVNLTTGTGNQADLCTGNTGSVPRLGFRHLCLQDGPVGIRYSMSTTSSIHIRPSFLSMVVDNSCQKRRLEAEE
jgi:beta-glucosidase